MLSSAPSAGGQFCNPHGVLRLEHSLIPLRVRAACAIICNVWTCCQGLEVGRLWQHLHVCVLQRGVT